MNGCRLAPWEVRAANFEEDNMSKTARASITACVVLGIMVGLAPARVEADWDDRSGSLPGITSGKSVAILSAAVGAAVVTLYLLKKKSNADKPAEPVQPALARTAPAGASTDDLVRILRADPRLARVWRLGAQPNPVSK
jgi:hypothetical protein